MNEPSFIVTRPGERHEYRYDPGQPSRHLFVHFTFEGAETEAPPLRLLQRGGPPIIRSGDELLANLMKQLMLVAYLHPGNFRRRAGLLLLTLLEELDSLAEDSPADRPEEAIPPQIAKALDYIDKHLGAPLTVDELAASVGWTHEHLSRSFVRFTGRSPRETIVHRKIERACQLLLHEERSVKEIAYSLGYSDENYFYRVFKQVKGITAVEYRRKYFNPWYSELHPIGEGDTPYPQNRILFNAAMLNDKQDKQGL
ncbi:helix-turn-helix domain-containing protein [Paenibacillus soyae]|uniref:AraC family transcriptional regulator n=1 Tax=Paenibacillus soyae TaxID=2969249 RepID=A0A9X2SBG1_9BACL|nr:AraC family transcriptional regulator [Paenibacillus soyae]MCR2805613.1 AraC family transcriptional regulator [Paenibacillus soyae]